MFLTTYFFSFLECHSDDVGISGLQQAVAGLREVAKLAKVLRERALQEEGKRKEVGAQLEPREVKLEGAQAELATARAEVTYFEVENSKS